MEGNSPTCPICGGSEYYEAEGFYYCSECQTQSQELREEVHDYNNFTGGLSSSKAVAKKKEKKKKKDEEEWTTWELHNFVLKGMVDELIALGASKRFKIIVLQLWTSYLRKTEVAFLSRSKSYKLPKLGMGYHERDARLIYGIDIKGKQKIKVRQSDPSGDASASDNQMNKADYNKSKRALFQAEYETMCDDVEVDSHSLFSESRKSFDESDTEGTKEIKRSYLSKAARKPQSDAYNSNRSVKYRFAETLARSALIAIIYIALMISQEKIQLSDVIRWIDGGELSYYEVTHFLPEAQKLKGKENLIFGMFTKRVSYAGIRKTARELVEFLDVTYIPSPDMTSLVTRYIEELHLPDEMVTIVAKVMCLYFQLEDTCSRPPPKELLHNYEGQAMGFIIVTLKLLLGLDGETEYKMSKVAEKLNKLLNNTSESTKLFVWTDWVKYIECRKSLLAHYHFPTQDALFQDAVLDPNPFISFWNKAKLKDVRRKERKVLVRDKKKDPQLLDAISTIMKKLEDKNERNKTLPMFVTSLTNQKTNLEVLMKTNLPDFEFATAVDTVLKEDFTLTTMKYLIHPKKYVSLAEKNDVRISIEKTSAQDKVHVVDEVKEKYFLNKKKLHLITRSKNSKFVAGCYSNGSYLKEKLFERSAKRKNTESECSPPRKRVKLELVRSPENTHLASENEGEEEDNDDYSSKSTSDADLDKIKRNILLSFLKEKNVDVDHLVRNKKRKSSGRKTKKDRSQKKIGKLGSSDNNNSLVVKEKEKNPLKDSSPPKDMSLECHEENNIRCELIRENTVKKSNSKESQINNKLKDEHEDAIFNSSTDFSDFESDRNCEKESESDLTMYVPNSEYWLYYARARRLSNEEFETKVMMYFPVSFQWLLRECSALVRMSLQELYSEMLNIELLLSDELDHIEKKRRKTKLRKV